MWRVYAELSFRQIAEIFGKNEIQRISLSDLIDEGGFGHGGGDEGIIRELYEFMSGTYSGFRAADINISVKNHLIGFAAEEARHGEKVVRVDEVFARYGFEND